MKDKWRLVASLCATGSAVVLLYCFVSGCVTCVFITVALCVAAYLFLLKQARIL